MCVIVFGLWTVSDSIRTLFVPSQHPGAAGFITGAGWDCPGASVSAICALRKSLSHALWVPCCFVCG